MQFLQKLRKMLLDGVIVDQTILPRNCLHRSRAKSNVIITSLIFSKAVFWSEFNSLPAFCRSRYDSNLAWNNRDFFWILGDSQSYEHSAGTWRNFGSWLTKCRAISIKSSSIWFKTFYFKRVPLLIWLTKTWLIVCKNVCLIKHANIRSGTPSICTIFLCVQWSWVFDYVVWSFAVIVGELGTVLFNFYSQKRRKTVNLSRLLHGLGVLLKWISLLSMVEQEHW